MARKAFTDAPQPTAGQIAAFEKGGPGTDQNPGDGETKQRFTFDIPTGLHRRFKMVCAAHGTIMARELLAMVEKRTQEMEQAGALKLD